MVSALRQTQCVCSRVRAGFALVDVIVATIILGVSLAVIISIAGRSLGAQQRGEELSTAARLADEQLQLVLLRGPDNYARRYSDAGVCDAPFDRFRYKLDFAGGASGEAVSVGATISWVSGASPQSITIQTLVATREAVEDGDPDPVRKPSQPVVRSQ